MLKKLAFLLIASGCLMTAKADTVNIASSATETTNNSGSATQNINGNTLWAAPFAGSSWVSNGNTGYQYAPGFTVVPNGYMVAFSDTFTLGGPVTAASLFVMADDTASVWLNGNLIYAAALGGSYPVCSSTVIGCLNGTTGEFTLSDFDNYFVNGANTLTFDVYQENGSSFGLDYKGSFTTDPPVGTPEPGTTVLLGAGLLGAALLSRKFALNS